MADTKKGLSRRDFLKTSGIAAGTLVGGGLIGGLVGYNVKKSDSGTAVAPEPGHSDADINRGLMFFQKRHDFDVLSQAVERIFPEDELGPGAIGLGVPYFIDNQLAGNYGSNAKEYMQEPFFEGGPTQGYQTRLPRSEVFLAGIAAMDQEANKRFEKSFIDIEGQQMDEILTDLQKDKIEMQGVSSSFFFKLLRGATLEGAYSDPLYNGNVNMEGWRMKGFPGHQMSYINVIEEEKFQKIEPKSLSSMQH
ncbi:MULTISPECIES: gluconate 2-dehydrogenase subunit 3 family protein [Sporosarcina]|uniref:gluconate 2-dehydrogenase subunit 3 family protein n=1 Tax=Sporosarcina TaxID=1569 RepID=UPI00129BDDF3|nr:MULTISPECIES: gluconate 2-dehydrogenase subunit 3 family protein [Sporosarcina]GKV67182.1 oxidoreductase [Sporosarcina sp. NCCP-2331]GLB57552.1 oxidoreductase [Sporosarcina sp. NCCP-2378]